MFGFGMGSLAPLILGVMSPVMGLSGGIASLAVIWIVAALVLLAARMFFFDKDAAALKKIQDNEGNN
jgi:hypothetical protein